MKFYRTIRAGDSGGVSWPTHACRQAMSQISGGSRSRQASRFSSTGQPVRVQPLIVVDRGIENFLMNYRTFGVISMSTVLVSRILSGCRLAR